MYNFKKLFTYMVVGALVIALSVSCKNNDKTGSEGVFQVYLPLRVMLQSLEMLYLQALSLERL